MIFTAPDTLKSTDFTGFGASAGSSEVKKCKDKDILPKKDTKLRTFNTVERNINAK